MQIGAVYLPYNMAAGLPGKPSLAVRGVQGGLQEARHQGGQKSVPVAAQDMTQRQAVHHGVGQQAGRHPAGIEQGVLDEGLVPQSQHQYQQSATHSYQQTVSQQQLAQQVQQADARIQADAARLQVEALRDGARVSTQIVYGRGPDGQSYIQSITVSRSERQSVSAMQSGGEGAVPGGGGQGEAPAVTAVVAGLSDMLPARIAFSPEAMAQAFNRYKTSYGQDGRAADEGLTVAEKQLLQRLQMADAAVRNHEGLHFRAAGGVASGVASYDRVMGPDGKLYAVAGKVDVQTSATFDPEKAARDAQTMALAASAPADASAQDVAVARSAYARAAETYSKALFMRGGQEESARAGGGILV